MVLLPQRNIKWGQRHRECGWGGRGGVAILLEDQRTFEQSSKPSEEASLITFWGNNFCRYRDQQVQNVKVGASLTQSVRWRRVGMEVGEGAGARTRRTLLAMARPLNFTLSEMRANGRFRTRELYDLTWVLSFKRLLWWLCWDQIVRKQEQKQGDYYNSLGKRGWWLRTGGWKRRWWEVIEFWTYRVTIKSGNIDSIILFCIRTWHW